MRPLSARATFFSSDGHSLGVSLGQFGFRALLEGEDAPTAAGSLAPKWTQVAEASDCTGLGKAGSSLCFLLRGQSVQLRGLALIGKTPTSVPERVSGPAVFFFLTEHQVFWG